MEYIKEFKSDCETRGLTAHTIESYESCVKDFLVFCSDPTKVTPESLRSYLGDLRSRGYQASTLLNYFAALNAFFDFMVFEGVLKANPVPSFRKRYLRVNIQRGGDNARQLISIEQMSKLIKLANGDIFSRTMMLFLAKTGLRRGELISMDLLDIDLERGEFMVKPKPKRSNRRGFLDEELTAALRKYLDLREPKAIDNALWVTEGGYRVSRNGVYYTVIRYAKLAVLHDPHGPLCKRFGPHCFRHFFTTMLRRSGMPREFIQELRGDRRREAVDIYDHIDVEELRESYLQHIPYLSTGHGRLGTLDEWCKENGSV